MEEVLHASTVAVEGRGLLILGPSGSGKSALALELMAFGAELVADDRTIVTAEEGALFAAAPAAIAGMIEARYIGLLNAPARPRARIFAAMDLGRVEEERLPPRRKLTLLGADLPLLHKPVTGHFAAATFAYMRSGRRS
ncbi:HPr kinase/phosphorylase [Pseudoroseicyclus tamaricis]|uniref:HPr kinase/phosphorylase n=1 Tax=Pseudoroseicyclus tamaricis TaxID=2705421 RepID=UPI001F174243|nr:serine kinase [Pseudoroseicyclus tamaricis]